jgi:hypothetical protein
MKRSPKLCRRLAFGAWALLGGIFVIGQFVFLGWVGPGPVFLFWSIVATPLLALTAWWLRRFVRSTPWLTLATLAAIWSALLVAALIDPFTDLRGVAPWSAFLGMLLFPVILTYAVLAQVEERVPGDGTA